MQFFQCQPICARPFFFYFNEMNPTKVVRDNINKWDDLSPLNEQQVKSILLLSEFNQNDSHDPIDIETTESQLGAERLSQTDLKSPKKFMHKVKFQILSKKRFSNLMTIKT